MVKYIKRSTWMAKMKNILLVSTRFRVFLTEIPPIILLSVVVRFNDKVDTVFKLYPLIIFLSALILFIPIYFLRGVIINHDELKCIGVFSSHDRAYTGDDKTIVLTCLEKRRIKIELYEKSGSAEVFSWIDKNPNEEINIFRAKARGTERTAKKILQYFGVDNELAEKLIASETSETELEDIFVRSEFTEEGKRISIRLKETE